MYMTPAVNVEEYYLELRATQTGNVEEAYDDIIVGEAAANVQVQTASNGYSYKGSTKEQLATTEVEKLEKVLRAEILRARRMRLFMLTVIIVTFLVAVAALILVIMKTADGEGSAAPKQETKAQDINECETGKHHCDSNAFCNNTNGSYICTCKPGHTGNGVNCTDINECETGKHYCDSNAFCNNTNGSYICTCKPGYTGNDVNCTDPCGSSPCKNNGTCQSEFAKKGYRCLCRGWTGARCQMDIDECDEKSDECNKNADCRNTKGSYRCQCKTGFHGDGYNCTDIDECGEKRCGKNATCTNTEGSFRCTCNIGYYGDGYKCTECYTIFDFEDHDLSNWTLNGTAFNNQPTYGNNTLSRPGRSWSNHKGDWWIGTTENRSSPSEPFGGEQGDGPQGSLTSPSFQITGKFLTFLIGAGCADYTGPNIRAELIIGGEVVRKEIPRSCKEAMTEKSWNVTDYAGKNAQLRLVDHFSGHFGHINFDHLQACHKLISDTDP